MQWQDRVYGAVSIEDPGILGLIACATFQRLKGVRQAGPSALAFPFKDVTRYEHSLGVFVLLRSLGADRREQVAGLLHDVSHTAFSHAVDFVFATEEQDHHEQLKPLLLDRPDIAAALERLGYSPRDFYDDSIYFLLEQPLPRLCADRLDYFLRDGIACGVVDRVFARRILSSLAVVGNEIVLTDVEMAREARDLFCAMNRRWWASETEAFIYNEFADALREGLRLGVLTEEDFLTEDDIVLAKLRAARNPFISQKLAAIYLFRDDTTNGYSPRVVPKERWLDPTVQWCGSIRPLSLLEQTEG
jgi:hypothetical protein